MSAKRYVRLWTLMAVIMIYGQIASAALWEDPDAFISGRVPFGDLPIATVIPNINEFFGFVDYAVYAPGDYSGSITFSDDLFVYAYQVTNTPGSTVGIDYFSVGLLPAVQVPNVAYDPAMSYAIPGGSNPTMHFKLPESVIYLYLTDNIGEGERSMTLLFTSNYGPQMEAYGYVAGGSAGGAIVELPSPVPEPATISLISAGTLLAFRRRTKS